MKKKHVLLQKGSSLFLIFGILLTLSGFEHMHSKAHLLSGPQYQVAVSRTPKIIVTPTQKAPTTSKAVPVVNLLLNGGFERDADNDGGPDSWTPSSQFTRAGGLFYSGEYSGKISATDDASVTVSQVIPNLTAGKTYTFTGLVQIPLRDDSFTFKILIGWRNARNSIIHTQVIETYTTSTSGWNPTTVTLSAPTGTKGALLVLNATSLNGNIYVDTFIFK